MSYKKKVAMANINSANAHIKVLAINPHERTIQVMFMPACYDEEDGYMVITPTSAKDAMNTKQMLVYARTTIGLLRVELIGEDNSYGYLWPGITMGGAIFRGMLLIVKNKGVSLNDGDIEQLCEAITWRGPVYRPLGISS